jgi:predicted O-linked N-acetylglucosamine transferase (SPINDLY family)
VSLLGRIFRKATQEADAALAQGNAAERAGNLAQAADFYRHATAVAPRYAKAYLNLGIALEALSEIPGAVAAHEKAIALEPQNPFANYNLAKLRYAQNAFPEAEQLLRRALSCRPTFREAHFLLGCVLAARGQAQSALQAFDAAVQLGGDDFATLYHRAQLLRSLRRAADARATLQRALGLAPDNVDARAALADVLLELGDTDGAISALEAVLAHRPDWTDALYNYGLLLKNRRRLPEAESALRRALVLSPSHAGAARLLGGVLLGQGRTQESLELYATARRHAPDDFALESAELFALLGYDGIDEDALFRRHVNFGRRIEAATPARSHERRRDPERRLRIGYLSGDFCYHVISLSMLPLLEHHDRACCETYCYSTAQSPDDYTRRLAEHAGAWRTCAGLSTGEIAQAIARDEIDILVDLAGHSGDPQLAVMAGRPAPVQATWIGYLHSTGLTRIDYRITDDVADPPGMTERYHTEALARLPHAQWCWRPFLSLPHAATPPSVKKGHVTFGSIHGAMKLSPRVRALWAELLATLPEARLVVLGVPAGRAQDSLMRDLGVTPERMTLVPYVSLESYFRWFDAIDIVLDTMPYSGAMTTCDALYMGVPVLTAPGLRSASRSAASVLTSVGLTEWIASDREDYVRRAVGHAANSAELAALRATLRARMEASPLMDEERFVSSLEDAYRRMWRQWCAGTAPQGWSAAPQRA